MDQITENRTWAEISRSALRHNLNVAKELTGGTKIMCVIKGNAHGHGAVECGRTLEQAGADAFAVASLEEAVELREAGIRIPILVLGWTDPRQAAVFCDYDILQSGLNLEYVRELSDQMVSQQDDRKIGIHVKLDTGMTRTGVDAQGDPADAASAVETMMTLPGIQVTGLFTHFAAADMPEKDDYTAMQLKRYKAVLAELEERGVDTSRLLKHTGNSASIMYHPETIFDMMREGVMMYGFYPNGIYDPDGPLEPVLSLNCRIAQVKEIPAGTSVSYGCTFTSDRPMKIAAVTAGYADAYPRSLSNKGAWAMINGQKCPQIGRICMDMCMFDVTGKEVKAGDRVILYGRGGMHLDELTALIGTINCEPTCLITNRVKKIYVD